MKSTCCFLQLIRIIPTISCGLKEINFLQSSKEFPKEFIFFNPCKYRASIAELQNIQELYQIHTQSDARVATQLYVSATYHRA